MKTILNQKFRATVLSIVSLGLISNPIWAATNIWNGSGVTAGTPTTGTLWDDVANYSGGTATFSSANDMDFSTITSPGSSITLSAGSAGTYSVNNLNFGTTSSTITSAEILNFNGNGTVGATTLNLSGGITLPSPSGSIVTMGSDLTLNLTNAAHALNFAKNNNITVADTVIPVLVIGSKITGGGASASIAWGINANATYGNTFSSTQNLVLTNGTSDFDATIGGIRGTVGYTSIGNIGAASSVGTGTTGVISMSNSGYFNYVGAGNQTTNRVINLNGSSYINNFASDNNSTLTLNGTFGSSSTAASGTQTLRTVISTGNTIEINSVIADVANTVATAVQKIGGTTNFYNASGTYDTTNGNGNGTLVLNAANTYTASTTINAGTVKLGNASGLGNGGAALQSGVVVNSSGNGGTTVSSGATLDLNGQAGVNEVITISGTGVGGNGALVNNSTTAASIAGGVISSLSGATVTGLSAVPTVSFTGGGGTGATAVAKLGLSAASFGTVSVTGTYTTAPTVTITGGGGTGATATVSTAGVITITNPGSGYTSAPTITFTGGAGTGSPSMSATGNATAFILDTLQVTNAGSGYTSAPTVSFSSGTVTTTATANLSSVILGAAGTSIGGTGDINIGAVVSGSGLGITKVGAGTLTLSGANTYTGTTIVNNGTVKLDMTGTGSLAATSALTLGGGNFQVKGASAGSSQTLGAFTLTANTNNIISLDPNNGTGVTLTLGNAWTRNAGSSMLFDYSSSNTGTRTVNTAGATTGATLTNGIYGWGLVKDSAGVTGFATRDGSGNISRFDDTTGTTLANNSNVSTTNFTTLNTAYSSGTLTWNNGITNRSVNSLTFDTTNNGGTIDMGISTNVLTLTSKGVLFKGANNGIITGGQVGAAASEVIVHQTGSGLFTINSLISSGAGSLTKDGTGTLVLGATNTYTGATMVNAGTLSVTGSLASGSAVGVAKGATLRGTGTIGGATTLASGAILAAGVDSSTIGALTFSSTLDVTAATVSLKLNSTSGTFDSFVANGLTLGGATLSLVDLGSGVWTGASSFTILNNTSGSSVSGTFFGLAEGASLTVGGNNFTVSYLGGTGNDITLTVSSVPEPATYAALFGTLVLGVALMNRRRSKKSL